MASCADNGLLPHTSAIQESSSPGPLFLAAGFADIAFYTRMRGQLTRDITVREMIDLGVPKVSELYQWSVQAPDFRNLSSFSANACYMDGGGRYGVVRELTRFEHPVKISGNLMEALHSTILKGDAARQFARMEGFSEMQGAGTYQPGFLTSDSGYQKGKPPLALIMAMDKEANMAGAFLQLDGPGLHTNTSVMPGSGIYVDQEIGAAAAIGPADLLMRTSAAAAVVKGMSSGLSPGEAGLRILKEIAGIRVGENRMQEPLILAALHKNGTHAVLSVQQGVKFVYHSGLFPMKVKEASCLEL